MTTPKQTHTHTHAHLPLSQTAHDNYFLCCRYVLNISLSIYVRTGFKNTTLKEVNSQSRSSLHGEKGC